MHERNRDLVDLADADLGAPSASPAAPLTTHSAHLGRRVGRRTRGRARQRPRSAVGRAAELTYTHRTIAGVLREARLTALK